MFLKFGKYPGKTLSWSSFRQIASIQITASSFTTYVYKILENSLDNVAVEFLLTQAWQALKVSPQNSCSEELFGKTPGKPASLLKKNSNLDVSLESMQSMQKFSEQLFFQNTNGQMLPNYLFLEDQSMLLET